MNFIDENKLKNRLIDMDATLNDADAAHIIHGIIDSINSNKLNIDKPLLPENIAGYFKELDDFGINDSWEMISYFISIGDTLFIEWIKSAEHRRQILLACLIGYEVEKEKKYRVRVKGLSTHMKNLLRYHTYLKTFELAGVSTNAEHFKTEFTKIWLKDNFPEYEAYNNAGLLEFEETDK